MTTGQMLEESELLIQEITMRVKEFNIRNSLLGNDELFVFLWFEDGVFKIDIVKKFEDFESTKTKGLDITNLFWVMDNGITKENRLKIEGFVLFSKNNFDFQKNKMEVVDGINLFYEEMGECFIDYFLDDNVKKINFAIWLVGKGFINHGNRIVRDFEMGVKTDMQETFYIHYRGDSIFKKYDRGLELSNFDKDIELWAEFLVSFPSYHEKILKFLKKNNQ